ncbi:MAG: hypothetical protein J6Y43_05015 [Clostridia bacterium]|nr:hypothetical protein [Clostridia bacterium]
MIFYFNSNGESLGFTSERVFQGSNLATRIYFVCPVSVNSVVSVAFTLPDGTNSGPHLMLSASGEISGVVNSQGEDFNNWYFDIPESVTAVSGNVGVQFAVTSGESVMTTSTCVFVIESGVYPQFSEQVMSYREIMAFLQRLSLSGGSSSAVSGEVSEEIASLTEDVAALESAIISIRSSISSLTSGLTTANNGISSLGTRMTAAENSVTSMQNDLLSVQSSVSSLTYDLEYMTTQTYVDNSINDAITGLATETYVDNSISAAIDAVISTPV